MNKITIIFLITISSYSANAKWGWNYKNFTLFYGGQYNYNIGLSNNFEFLYERYLRTCTRKIYYHGFGLTTTFNNDYQQFGVKGIFNPLGGSITVKGRNFPYLLFQTNFKRQNKENDLSKDINFCTGVGINSMYYLGNKRNRVFMFRTSLIFGYTFGDAFVLPQYGFNIEFKVGIGLNKVKIIRKNESQKKALSFVN